MGEKEFNNNIDYWDARYKRVGADRTAGAGSWTPEQYKEANAIWYEWFTPYLELAYETTYNGQVLDFGCGAGRWFPLLSTYYTYHGTDIIPLETMGITKPEFAFEPVYDNRIPFANTQFDLIWTCVCLQHVIDDNLLEHYVTQFSERLQIGGMVICVENTAAAKANTYIKFRSIEEYTNLFIKHGFRCIGTDTKKMKGEPHTLFTFDKKINV